MLRLLLLASLAVHATARFQARGTGVWLLWC